jgi:hypothetical protein
VDEWLIDEDTSTPRQCPNDSMLGGPPKAGPLSTSIAVEEAILSDPIGALVDVLRAIVHFFETVAPGGFGLILIPLIILGVISILAARRR